MICVVGEGGLELDVSVIGAGYVGLVTAACLATLGHRVRCVDRDQARIAALSRGVLPFREPGLDEAVTSGLANGRLAFFDDPGAVHGTDLVLVAVGTLDAAGEWTGDYVESAVCEIAADSLAPRTMVVRSTLLPGTTERLVGLARNIDGSIEMALNPEFTRQGMAIHDFMNPDRVVVGTTRPDAESTALRLLRRIYEPIGAPLIVTDAASAELIKIGANVFLALKIGYANELARLAAATGADVSTVVDAIGLDGRIGREFMTPGPGFGGSCLPSQARALPRLAAERSVSAPILTAIEQSNRAQIEWVVEVLEQSLGALAGKQVALLGVTFKAGTDDLRESPALAIGRGLAGRGASLSVHDPLAEVAGLDELLRAGVSGAGAGDVTGALAGADAVVLATEWPAYRSIDWQAAAAAMRGRLVLDTRGIGDADVARAAGLTVIVHGRR